MYIINPYIMEQLPLCVISYVVSAKWPKICS